MNDVSMEYPIIVKPQKRNYLLFHIGFVWVVSILTFFGFIVFSAVYSPSSRPNIGPTIGYWLGGLLLWVYDEITGYKRFAIIISKNSVQIPAPITRSGPKVFVLSPDIIDKARTRSHNSKPGLNNKLGYTFWVVNGESITIAKLWYSSSQIKLVLDELELTQ